MIATSWSSSSRRCGLLSHSVYMNATTSRPPPTSVATGSTEIRPYPFMCRMCTPRSGSPVQAERDGEQQPGAPRPPAAAGRRFSSVAAATGVLRYGLVRRGPRTGTASSGGAAVVSAGTSVMTTSCADSSCIPAGLAASPAG